MSEVVYEYLEVQQTSVLTFGVRDPKSLWVNGIIQRKWHGKQINEFLTYAGSFGYRVVTRMGTDVEMFFTLERALERGGPARTEIELDR